MTKIKGFHAHVYFDAQTKEQARALCEEAKGLFSIKMGRVHERNVGPHPRWSCQLAFAPDRFGEVIPWLAINRNQLVVFGHPETGDDIKDHTEHAMWMGELLPLELSALKTSD